MNDEDLWIKKAQKDPQHFGPLYEATVDRVFRYLFLRTRDRALAEDLTSQTFMKALQALPRYRPSKAPFIAWLFRIARNTLIDHHRTQRDTAPLEAVAEQESDDPRVEHQADQTLRYEKAQKLLATLDPDERDMLLLKITSGLTFREIAALCGKSENTVKTTYFRRIRQLRTQATLLILLVLLPLHS